jgi:predicted RecA/RadA family phage recombinase
MMIDGPIDGVVVAIGHGIHTHVINNTGGTLVKGTAVRHDGVSGGKPQVAKAIATSFENARLFGIVAQDILDGEEGSIATFGVLDKLNTSGLPVGVPLYLSDTVAGTYTTTAPDIVSRIGGILVQDASIGELFISMINNKTIPTVLGGLQGQTPGNEIYNVTAIPQDITDYALTETVVMTVAPLTGIVNISNLGKYRINFGSSISFPSLASTRSVTFEVYNITTAEVVFAYIKNIPRDSIEDSLSFSAPFSGIAGHQYKMRIKSSVDIDVTVNNISFDIQSVTLVE